MMTTSMIDEFKKSDTYERIVARVNVAEQSLSFDEETHTYTDNGIVIPSVTEILGRFFGQSYYGNVPKNTMEFRAAVGKAVHKMCEYVDAVLEYNPDEQDPLEKAVQLYTQSVAHNWGSEEAEHAVEWWEKHVIGYVKSYVSFLRTVKPLWLLAERMVYLRETARGMPGYAGRFDRIGIIKNIDTGKHELAIADLKTSRTVPPYTIYQFAGYARAIDVDNNPPSGVVVKLMSDGQFSLQHIELEHSHLQHFEALAEAYHVIRAHEQEHNE